MIILQLRMLAINSFFSVDLSFLSRCGFQSGHLLVHVHEQWGMVDITQLTCLANGANGIWAGLCGEGAAMGHASSAVTLLNLIRLGNKKVLKNYNCTELRNAAMAVTQITTGLPPHPKQPIYGARALDMVFGIDQFIPTEKEFSMARFFGEEPVMRMTTLASPKMVVQRMQKVFGDDAQFTEEMAKKMLEKMLEDLHANRKEEYMSAVGLALLFDRAGGKLTAKMCDAVAEVSFFHFKFIFSLNFCLGISYDKPFRLHYNMSVRHFRKPL